LKTKAPESQASDGPQLGILVMAMVFLPLAAGYFLSFLFRSINAMIAPRLVVDLGLSPDELGLMTAAYFLGFGLFQLPLGLLLDRFGPALVQSALLAVAAAGAMIFSLGDTVLQLSIGRGLIGVGVAGSLMSSFTAFAIWFPRRNLPLIYGCFMGFGGLGALAAAKPVEWALGITDWRGLFYFLSAVTFAVATLVLICLPKPGASTRTSSWRDQIKGLAMIYGNPLFQRVAPLAVTTIATGLSVQGLWAGTWLRDVAALDPSDVANHLSLIAIGLTIGPALAGLTYNLARQLGFSQLTLFGAMAVLFMFFQFLINLELTSVSYVLWGGYGLLINAMAISYALLSQAFPKELAGRLNTNLNMVMIFVAFAAQYLVGWLIGFWPVTDTGGYAPAAYQVGFGVLLGMQALGFVWFVFAGRDRVRTQ
jgi:MFS family permease